MPNSKEYITPTLFFGDFQGDKKVILEMIDSYARAAELIERTRVAMGKTKAYTTIASSTTLEKLNTYACSSTYQNFSRLEQLHRG